MNAIQTFGIKKRFGTTTAVNDISLAVETGKIYGFLGLNGAGKTTLIRMLLGMIRPDEGRVELFGEELNSRFRRWNDIGYLVETPYSYPNLTVRENLKVHYALRGLQKPGLVDEIMERLKLTQYANKRAAGLSLGNQQRMGLARAMMHKPRLLILDEPINGLDPEGIVEVRELMKELAANGTTIFVSSHILEEISKIADVIAIVHQGKLVGELTAHELSERLERKLMVSTKDNVRARQTLIALGFHPVLQGDGTLALSDVTALAAPERVSAELSGTGTPPLLIHPYTEDLEHFFLRTIKHRQ
ncbi:MAG: ABC transporter ATP-binding protein [Taibaiella sp.]|nr:ABC transporter ATP-binding protein [Taibaiella sp.]